MDIINAAGMDETYGTYVDECFGIHDDVDCIDHDADDDTCDDTDDDTDDTNDDNGHKNDNYTAANASPGAVPVYRFKTVRIDL